MDRLQAKKIMGENFIGPEELSKISSQLGIANPLETNNNFPEIIFNEQYLQKIHQDYILILGIPTTKNNENLTINRMRLNFGWDSEKSEPCFYNQDWYLNEDFADKIHLEFAWYLVKKDVIQDTRGRDPKSIEENLAYNQSFPKAILTTFTFFAYYFHINGQVLWKHDFVWCSDKDKNGDRIYIGRYEDPIKINKNGFNVHRHLSLRQCYGMAPQII